MDADSWGNNPTRIRQTLSHEITPRNVVRAASLEKLAALVPFLANGLSRFMSLDF
jgi:hypothetical protein